MLNERDWRSAYFFQTARMAPVSGLPVNVLPMADAEYQNGQGFMLDLVNDPELPASPAVQALKLAAQRLALVGIA